MRGDAADTDGGFASMDAGNAGGRLTTRQVRFTGTRLFVNAAVANGGEPTAEVLGEDLRPLPGLSAADCVVVRGDKAKQSVAWKNADLAAAAGRPVRLRFRLTNGRLFAFWVSKEASGASGGYAAAGGPGLTDRDA